MSVLIVALAVCAVAVAGAVVWLRTRWVMVSVSGTSMEPAYRSGDRVWVRRARVRSVRPGQVVVVRLSYPPSWNLAVKDPWSIKRVTAAPGDPVPRDGFDALAHVPEATVPAGCLVVVGDNAADSYDSRHCGYVPGDRLLGVVVRRAGAG
ncbi:S26 family signal peptidase [Nonomuraea maritima]|uniref:S26 family signal peptidase n=1 Tax=Nonomuraea maritima TaxID=683260 RepID=UPI0037237688